MIELPVELIISIVADYFHLTIDEIKSPRKFGEYVRGRQVAMYFCRIYTSLSERRIGEYFKVNENFKAKNHATVFHSSKKVKELMGIYPRYKIFVTEIDVRLKKEVENYTEDLKVDESEVFQENDYYKN